MKNTISFGYLSLMLSMSLMSCKTEEVNSPCRDEAQLITTSSASMRSTCHPQASINASPIGSSGVVLVTCKCNILPAPCDCDCGCSKGSCKLHDPVIDGGTDE